MILAEAAGGISGLKNLHLIPDDHDLFTQMHT